MLASPFFRRIEWCTEVVYFAARVRGARPSMAKKKASSVLPKLTEAEQDLLSHLQHGYQLETDSLGGNPVLRQLKDN